MVFKFAVIIVLASCVASPSFAILSVVRSCSARPVVSVAAVAQLVSWVSSLPSLVFCSLPIILPYRLFPPFPSPNGVPRHQRFSSCPFLFPPLAFPRGAYGKRLPPDSTVCSSPSLTPSYESNYSVWWPSIASRYFPGWKNKSFCCPKLTFIKVDY